MIITSSDSFTRPADTTAYADGDLVANSTTAGDVVPLEFKTTRLSSGRGIIRRAILFKDDETIASTSFDLHLFSQAPAVNNGDNGAFQPTTARHYLGSISFDMSTGVASATDAAKAAGPSIEINFDLYHVSARERRLYGLLEVTAAGGYPPNSGELFEVTLEMAGVD